MGALPSLGPAFDPGVPELIELVTISQEHRFWPDEVVTHARGTLVARYGRIPSLDDLCSHYDPNTVFGYAKTIIERRAAEVRELAERMGYGSACHFCWRPRGEDDGAYLFGLAKVIEQKTNWGGALAMLALNIVTVPLGVGVAARPGSTTRAHIARCRLVLCVSCAGQRRSFFGALRVEQQDCHRHPSWQRLQAAGFTKFLTIQELANYH